MWVSVSVYGRVVVLFPFVRPHATSLSTRIRRVRAMEREQRAREVQGEEGRVVKPQDYIQE